jgi:hypothetical protein
MDCKEREWGALAGINWLRAGKVVNWEKYELRPALKKLYQLRPKATASSVSVASRVFNPKYTSCVPRLVRNCISCIER